MDATENCNSHASFVMQINKSIGVMSLSDILMLGGKWNEDIFYYFITSWVKQCSVSSVKAKLPSSSVGPSGQLCP